MCCLLIIALNLGLITITVNVPVMPQPPPSHYEAPAVRPIPSIYLQRI